MAERAYKTRLTAPIKVEVGGCTTFTLPQEVAEKSDDVNERRKSERQLAVERLQIITLPPGKSSPDLIEDVLIFYGYTNSETDDLTELTKSRLLFKLIAHDVLLQDLYNTDGSPSPRMEELDPDIDPDDFKVISGEWHAVKQLLEARVINQAGTPSDPEYSGTFMGRNLNHGLTLIDKYVELFGQGSIISLPYTIEIDKNNIQVKPVKNFIKPYGGNGVDRLIFIPKEDYFQGVE